MSYKSMEAIMNVFNTREFYKPKKQYSKEAIIYSDEVVDDFKRIAKAKTSREQLALSMELYDEFRTIDSVIRREFYNLYKRQEITKGLHKFGAEAVRFYLSMEDGEAPSETPAEGKAAPANPGKLAGLKEALGKAWEKFITMVSSFFRWMQGIISSLIARRDTIDPAKFDASKFTNMDAEINAPPYKQNLFKELDQTIRDSSVELNRDTATDSYVKKDVDKEINQIFYGTDEKPKKQKTTVGKFLNCTAGQKPKLLEVCSKKYLDDLIALKKSTEETIKAAKQVYGKMKKALSGDDLKRNKQEQYNLTFHNNKNVKLFKEALSARYFVSYAIKKGLSKKGGEAKPAEQPTAEPAK